MNNIKIEQQQQYQNNQEIFQNNFSGQGQQNGQGLLNISQEGKYVRSYTPVRPGKILPQKQFQQQQHQQQRDFSSMQSVINQNISGGQFQEGVVKGGGQSMVQQSSSVQGGQVQQINNGVVPPQFQQSQLIKAQSQQQIKNYSQFMKQHFQDLSYLDKLIKDEQLDQASSQWASRDQLKQLRGGVASSMDLPLSKYQKILQQHSQVIPQKRLVPSDQVEKQLNLSIENNKNNFVPQQPYLQQVGVSRKAQSDRLPQVSYSMKDLNVKRLPDDDQIIFEAIANPRYEQTLDRFLDHINNDNDVLYLEASFPNYFSQVITESEFSSINNRKSGISVNESAKPIAQMGVTITTTGTKNNQQQNNQNIKNLIQICFEDNFNNFQSMPKQYQKYHNPQIALQMKSIQGGNNIQNQQPLLFNKPNSLKAPSNAPSHSALSNNNNQNNYSNQQETFNFAPNNQNSQTPSENNTKTPGTAERNAYFNTRDDYSEDLHSKINSTFFNRKFANVPQITREQFVEDLFPSTNKTIKIYAQTKYGVKIDVGIINVREEEKKKKIVLEKLYIIRLYRKLQHLNYINIQAIWYVFQHFPHIDKIQMTINSRTPDYLKFLYQIGFKLDYVEGEKTANKKYVISLKKSVFTQSMEEILRRFSK